MEDYLASVRRLNSSLEEYAREHPHVVPFSLLEEATDEARILNPDAAILWQEIAQTMPDDGIAQHHLALIRHGMAFRSLDLGQHDEESIANWKAGLHHWRTVLQNDDLWNHLTSIWTARRDSRKGEKLAERLLEVDLHAFRRALPEQLLAIHVQIIQDTIASSPDAAKAHIKLIRDSGFADREIRDAVNQVYKRTVGARKDGAPDQAVAALDAYLSIDPHSTRALHDRLRVAIRICSDTSVGYDSSVAAMKAVQEQARTLKKLVEPNDVDYDRSMDVLREYHLEWGRRCNQRALQMDDDTKANALYREAFRLVDQACDFERTGVSAKRLLWTLADNMAFKCSDSTSQAARLLDEAIEKYPNQARLVLARARVRLYEGEFTRAIRDVEQAEQLNRLTMDPEVTKGITDIRQDAEDAREFGSMTSLYLFYEACGLMNKGDWHAAVEKLTASRAAQPRENKATIKLIEHLFLCYEKTFDSRGKEQCANDYHRLKARFD